MEEYTPSNREQTQARDSARRGIGRMGQPPITAVGSMSRKDRDRKRNSAIKRAKHK